LIASLLSPGLSGEFVVGTVGVTDGYLIVPVWVTPVGETLC
jgi:hypothetical protein